MQRGILTPVAVVARSALLALAIVTAGATANGAAPEAGAAAATVPPDAALRQLVDRTLQDFDEALQKRDFKIVLANASQPMKEQVTAATLQEAFQDLIDQEVELSFAKSVAPVYDPRPALNENGVLVVAGAYPGKALRAMFRFKYLYEAPAWKLCGIQVESVPEAPSAAGVRALVDGTMREFSAALQAKSFAKFHATIATSWKRKITEQDLLKAFQSFIDKEVDLSRVTDMAPVYDKPPAVRGNGVLTAAGRYPTTPQAVVFHFQYSLGKTGWRLVQMQVKTEKSQPAALPQLPAESELRRLTDETILAFAEAVRKKDFSGFYERFTKAQKQQGTAKDLQAAFQEYIDKQVDLSCIKGVAPVYDKPPAIDKDGSLSLKGAYPSKPLRVTFDLSFGREAESWKLDGLTVGFEE
jgi:Ca2+-binding EF-hand superfamily protein